MVLTLVATGIPVLALCLFSATLNEDYGKLNHPYPSFNPFNSQRILGLAVDGVTVPAKTLYGYGSKKCADVNSGSKENHGVLDIWGCVEGEYGINEQFEAIYNATIYDPVAKDYAALVQIVSKVSNKCVTEDNLHPDSNSPVYQFECDTGKNQLWYGRPSAKSTPGNIWFSLVSKSGQCLTVRNGSSDNGALLTVYPCSGSDNQLWLYSF